MQLRLSRQVVAVRGQVLRDQVQLDGAFAHQPLRFDHDVVDRPAPLQPAQRRDDAEGALVVAALGDLHVGRPARHRVAARRFGVRDVVGVGYDRPIAFALENLGNARISAGADEVIDLRHLLLEDIGVALREAAGDNQRFAAAGFFELGVLEDGVDRFLLGLTDEGAGVDQDDLGLFRLLDDRVAVVEQAAEHDLAVHPVLRAAERQ